MENIETLPSASILDFYDTQECLDSDIVAITQSENVGAGEEDYVSVRIYSPTTDKVTRKLFSHSEFVLYSQLILKAAKQKRDNYAKLIRTQAYLQMEVRLTDIVNTDLILAAIQNDAKKLKIRTDSALYRINRDATIILRKFIPAELLHVYKIYGESFKSAPGFLYPYEFISRDNTPEICFVKITPNLPMYLAPNFEIEALKTGTINRSYILKTNLWYYTFNKKKYEGRVKRLSNKLLARAITYKELLDYKAELFEFVYNYLNTKKLIKNE